MIINLQLEWRMESEIIGAITNIETIAVGSSIYDISRLRNFYGIGDREKWKVLLEFVFPIDSFVKQSSTGRKHMVSEKRNEN